MPRPSRRVATALSCALLASLALAACGGSGKGDPASPVGNTAAEGLQFSRCMRENGVTNFPDPESAGGAVRLQFKAGARVNPQTMEKAQKACQKYAPEAKQGPNLTPAEKVEHEEAVQKFAKCMREHGVELEAQTSNGGAGIELRTHAGGAGGAPGSPSPAFREAQEDCQKLLPMPKGGLRGGPPSEGPPPGGAEGGSGGGSPSLSTEG